MEKIALKVGGVVFILMAFLHVLRIAMKVSVTVGSVHVPLRLSALGAVLALALGLWMLKLGCGCCCKK